MGAIFAKVKVTLVNDTTLKIVKVDIEDSDDWDFHDDGDHRKLRAFPTKPGDKTTVTLWPRRAAYGTPIHIGLVFEDGSHDKFTIDIQWTRTYPCRDRSTPIIIEPKLLKGLHCHVENALIWKKTTCYKEDIKYIKAGWASDHFFGFVNLYSTDYYKSRVATINHLDHILELSISTDPDVSCNYQTDCGLQIRIKHTEKQKEDMRMKNWLNMAYREAANRNHVKAIKILRIAYDKFKDEDLKEKLLAMLIDKSKYDYTRAKILSNECNSGSTKRQPELIKVHYEDYLSMNILCGTEKYIKQFIKDLLYSARTHAQEALDLAETIDIKPVEVLLSQIEFLITSLYAKDKGDEGGDKAVKIAEEADTIKKKEEAVKVIDLAIKNYRRSLFNLEMLQRMDPNANFNNVVVSNVIVALTKLRRALQQKIFEANLETAEFIGKKRKSLWKGAAQTEIPREEEGEQLLDNDKVKEDEDDDDDEI